MDQEQLKQFNSRMNAMIEVIRINNPEKFKDLNAKRGYWSPEATIAGFSEWVNANYTINPDDPVTLNVYSLLMNMPISEVKAKMQADLGNNGITK